MKQMNKSRSRDNTVAMKGIALISTARIGRWASSLIDLTSLYGDLMITYIATEIRLQDVSSRGQCILVCMAEGQGNAL